MLFVLFFLRYSKNPNSHQATIYCNFALGGQRCTAFTTGIRVDARQWKQKGTSRTGDVMNDKKLMLIENRISALHLRYELEEKPFTVHDIRRDFLAVQQAPPAPVPPPTFLAMYSAYVQAKRTNAELSPQTVSVIGRYYTNTEAALVAIGKTGVLIRDVDVTFMEELKAYLLANFAESTALKMLVYAKSVVDYAVLQKKITHNPIKPYKIGKPDYADPVYLTIEEEKRLLTTDLAQLPGIGSVAPRLERVRDTYIVLRELAIHYGDYLLLDDSMFKQLETGVWIFQKARKKTKVEIINIVTEPLQRILTQYGGPCHLPRLALQRYNDYLKILFMACGIDKRASSKIARKTFTDFHTNEEPAPDPTICAMLGLTSSKYLRHYRKVDHRALLRHFKPLPKEKND